MTANTFGERFMSKRVPAWHHIGQVFEQAISATEAVKAAKMDYQIVKAPLTATVTTIFGTAAVPVEGRFELIREPVEDDNVYRAFGEVSDDYQVLQNTEMATVLDTLTEGWPLETIGALGHGETVFMVLNAGEDLEIAGDQIKQYFLITDTKDGGHSFKMAFTPVRVVCWNTLVSGLKQATVTAAISHGVGMLDNITWRMGLLRSLQDAKLNTMATFQKLAEVALTTDELNVIWDAAYPLPNKPAKVSMYDSEQTTFDSVFQGSGLVDKIKTARDQWEYYCNLAIKRRDGVRERMDRLNDEFPKIANTPWAAYNAVVEHEDFRDGPETMFASAIFGDRARTKGRAMQAALTFLK